jgi:CheY-like chemotaxis protein
MSRGLGTTLIQRSLTNGGESAIRFGSHSVVCRIRLRLHDQGPQSVVLTNERETTTAQPATAGSNLQGKRVLLIEDEPLIAMEIGSQLKSAGCEVVGPAETVESARQLIAVMSFDAALVDANLAGSPVDELVAALMKKDIPFTFATGYGRDALPLGFRDAPVLTKPFSQDELFTGITNLVRDRRNPPD